MEWIGADWRGAAGWFPDRPAALLLGYLTPGNPFLQGPRAMTFAAILSLNLLGQCPIGCPSGACSPCQETTWSTSTPVRFVSNSPCVPTGYGGSDVIAQLAAQQERLGAQIRSMSEDLATIQWNFVRPVQRAAPLPVPSKLPPVPETYASPQASPQAMTPYEVPSPPPMRKAPPLPAPAMPAPQADAGEQWQRALQAGRYRVDRAAPPVRLGAVPQGDRAPYSLD